MSKYNLNGTGVTWTNAEGETMLEALKNAAIVSFSKLENGKYRIFEECDRNYYSDVTKSQLKDLANELLELSES